MKIKLALALIIVLFNLSAGASMPQRLNAVVGALTHRMRSCFYKDLSKPLKPEHEELVRSIQKKIGMTQDVGVYKLPSSLSKTGPHAGFNCIYLDELELENEPEGALFTIGHELMHVEKMHSLKTLGVALPVIFGLRYVADKAFNKVSARLVPNRYLDRVPGPLRVLLTKASRFSMHFLIGRIMHEIRGPMTMSQTLESEADRECVERLAQFYGRDKLIWSARQVFGSLKESDSWFESLLSTHPSHRKRIQDLGITEQASQKAGEQLLALLKERIRDHVLYCFGDSRIDLFLSYEIRYNASMVSVHDNVAQHFKKIIDGTILELFDTLMAYLKQTDDNDYVLELFTPEDRRLLECLRTKKVNPISLNNNQEFCRSAMQIDTQMVQKILDGEKSVDWKGRIEKINN